MDSTHNIEKHYKNSDYGTAYKEFPGLSLTARTIIKSKSYHNTPEIKKATIDFPF